MTRIEIIGLGGTISMAGAGARGVVPSLTTEDLVAAVPQLRDIAEIGATSLRMVPGWEVSTGDLFALAAEVQRRLADGADGVVVTQGTDTIEEVAYGLELLVSGDGPIVVTGAMRNPTLPGNDGPANVLAAVRVAASAEARGLGALVVLNDEIHAARYAHKTHTQSPATFRSPSVGPIGWVAEGAVRIVLRPTHRRTYELPADAPEAAVALIATSLGDDGRLLGTVESLGYAGLVVAGFGGGHVRAGWVEPLARLAETMPVVIASRTGAGELLRRTYGAPGSETDLLARGLISAGALDAPKARVLLTVLLSAGAGRTAIRKAFEQA